MSPAGTVQIASFSEMIFPIWPDQLYAFRKASIFQEAGSVNLIVDNDLIAFPEPTTAEWLNVAASAFEFWDNPLDALYDDL